MAWNWMNERIQRMNWVDIGVMKVCVFAFTLMVACFWPRILAPGWQVYMALFAVTYAYVVIRFFRR